MICVLLFTLFSTLTTNAMNILCITHADFETPGVIQDWAHKNKYHFTICKPYKGEILPTIYEFDLLIVMGGPQGACELDKDPYLYDEVALIKDAITHNKKVLGFCLGAQLIGIALGAQATRSPEKEIGVFPITLTAHAAHDPLLNQLPSEFEVIHWHNDMPGLTSTSEILAASAGCPRQIVKYTPLVYGFQCHLEITHEGIQTMINECGNDLKPSTYTQNEIELLEQNYETINQRMHQILNRFVQI